jgi:hypothetical protein
LSDRSSERESVLHPAALEADHNHPTENDDRFHGGVQNLSVTENLESDGTMNLFVFLQNKGRNCARD